MGRCDASACGLGEKLDDIAFGIAEGEDAAMAAHIAALDDCAAVFGQLRLIGHQIVHLERGDCAAFQTRGFLGGTERKTHIAAITVTLTKENIWEKFLQIQ